MSDSPFVVAAVTVARVTRVSPSFVRVAFAGPGLAELGTAGAVYDQRIKLILPTTAGVLPDIAGADSWWDAWRALPEGERGTMRTYSIRELGGEGGDRRLVVDLVLHLVPGATGPASRWAASAAPGDRVLVVGPRRTTTDGGGIEFAPGDAERLLLAGDETAVPAIARILADLPADARGEAFLEVPHADDVHELPAPDGVGVTWLPRGGAPFLPAAGRRNPVECDHPAPVKLSAHSQVPAHRRFLSRSGGRLDGRRLRHISRAGF